MNLNTYPSLQNTILPTHYQLLNTIPSLNRSDLFQFPNNTFINFQGIPQEISIDKSYKTKELMSNHMQKPMRNENDNEIDLSDELSPNNKAFGNYNRKEKSLGELSKRFLLMFGKVDECVISLDSVTQQLGVERRRIYDIINILESLGVIYRKGKNHYQWKGLNSIHKTIAKLQKAISVAKKEPKGLDTKQDSDNEELNMKLMFRKEKYLSFLSTGFIKLFISWKNVISLEQAAMKLTSENTEDNKIKTKIRRLYDIANVFSVLGLIKKISLESKKPAYQWVGLQGLDSFIAELHASQCEVDPARKFKEENPLFFPSQRNLEVKNNEEDGRLNKNPKDQMLENFFVMLLQFCRLELQSQSESLSSTSDLSIETLRIQDSESSSDKLGAGKDTKKEYINSVRSLKIEKEMEVFRKKGSERKEQNGFKRPATTSINKYEVHTLKKIPSLCTKNIQQKDCEIINEFPVEVKIEDNSE